MLAGLPYVVWPIGSFFILASRKKEDPFLCYHAVQSLLAGAVMTAFLLGTFLILFLGFRVMPGTASFGSPVNDVPGQVQAGDQAAEPVFLSSEDGPALTENPGNGFPPSAAPPPTQKAAVYAQVMMGLGTLAVGGGVTFTVFLTALFLGWRATEGEMLRLPFLGDIAEEKMLDQTGMTRRQFVEMCEAAFKVEPEEGIPFPELQKSSSAAPGLKKTPAPPAQERAIDRMEAARRARALKEEQQRQAPARQAPQRPAAQNPQARPAPQARPTQSRPQRRPQMPGQPPAQAKPPSNQPVVKEIDLIGHYKEKRVGTGRKEAGNDVLRQWLSSVDQES